MAQLVGWIPQTHANYASDDVPLDDNTAKYNCTFGGSNTPMTPQQYRQAWADAIHAGGLHVIFRPNFNNFAGDFGQPKLSYLTTPAIPYETSGGATAVLNGTDTTSYIALTYAFILNHAGLFKAGDVFEPFGEASGQGFTNCAAQAPYGACSSPTGSSCPNGTCQFPDVTSYNQWIKDFIQVEQAGFTKLGIQVYSGWFGVFGSTYSFTQPDTWAAAGMYNMDHFATTLYGTSDSTFQGGLSAAHTAFPTLPISVEWGDINSADWNSTTHTANQNCGPQANQDCVAYATDQYMGYAATLPYVTGFEYWYLNGTDGLAESGAINTTTGALTPAGQMVAKWFGTMSVAPTATPTATATAVATFTPTPTGPVRCLTQPPGPGTPTPTPLPAGRPCPYLPTDTPGATATATPTTLRLVPPTATATARATGTAVIASTFPPSATDTATRTSTRTSTQTASPTQTPTATATATATRTATNTPRPSPTVTAVIAITFPPSATRTETTTPSRTRTASPTQTAIATATTTATATASATRTPTQRPSATPTARLTRTATPTPRPHHKGKPVPKPWASARTATPTATDRPHKRSRYGP
jgi:hypothetical protein